MEGIENLEIMQWNARSINKNGSDLVALLTTHKPHIIAIQETWLTENNRLSYTSYDTYRIDRKNNRAGGILLLIKEGLFYSKKKLTPFNNGKLEIQVVTIKAN